MPETLKDHRIETVAKTPSENLAYQLGWLNLSLSWEEQEQRGLTVQTPAEGYKWNQLGSLYQSFLSNLWTNEFRKSADCVARHLRKKLLHWIDSLSEDELFFYLNNGLGRPPKHNGLFGNGFTLIALPLFTSFRTQIRKWKKSVSLKSYPHFFQKKLDKHFLNSPQKNFVDEISYFFPKTFPQCLFVRH
ncbi:ClbS/DfsB family four-helix bundle protein [Enterococcus faecalis]|uniref:ClbS/DfsB family four-helix bundle protein n=1 Tax=Enterococcus faecalis TaxID=1351 RepID=A0A974NZH2_ENTFL|nr:ClbS/DfsB family four-helix bundle protein [Enterococcus faecalis]